MNLTDKKELKKIGYFSPRKSGEINESFASIGFECLDRQLFKPECCYDHIGDSGIKYARVQTGWAICEKEKGVIDFTWLDDIVNNLLSRGVKPWFSVGFGNPIYMPDLPNPTGVGCVPLYYGEECLNAWRRFVHALAEHYQGKITHYEIWNEPDNFHFWYPEKPDGKEYARLVSITGAEIRAADANAKIGGCIAGTNREYVNDFASHLPVGDIDFQCFHQYLSRDVELNWEEEWRICFELFRQAGHNVSFWMGEGGFPSWVYAGHWMRFRKGNFSSERQQAVAHLRLFFGDVAFGFDRVSIFQVADMWERPYEKAKEVINKPAAQGILNGLTYTPKQAYYTLSRLANLFRDDAQPIQAYFSKTFNGSHCECMAIKNFGYKRGNQKFFAYWLPTCVEDEAENRDGFTLRAEIITNDLGFKEPVLLDMYTGDVFSIENIDVRLNGFTASNLPIGEYPFVICDRALIADCLQS